MNNRHPHPVSYQCKKTSKGLLVSCEYFEVFHSARHGGNIASIRFYHGSNKNIFAAPMSEQIAIGNGFYMYETANDRKPKISNGTLAGGGVWVEASSSFMSAKGEKLAGRCTHRYEYFPWGYIKQNVIVELPKKIENAQSFCIGRLAVDKRLDTFAYRPAPVECEDFRCMSPIMRWYHLKGGESFNDYTAAVTRNLPLYLTMLQWGVEGFDFFLGNDLDQWHRQVLGVPGQGEFRLGYNETFDGYQARFAVAERYQYPFSLAGKYKFEFYMSLPFIREYVPEMVHSFNALLDLSKKFPDEAIPAEKTIKKWADCGVELMRWHHDGDSRGGSLFWRTGGYPPYPPAVMKKMDAGLKLMKKHGIKTVAYFNPRELHAEVPEFKTHAKAWQRILDYTKDLQYDYVGKGAYGAQMCLASEGWLKFRKKQIKVVLDNHLFDGIYYDLCCPTPCYHRGHHPFTHWGIHNYINFLEWTRNTLGPDKVMDLHLSAIPFMFAENMADYVCTYEEGAPKRVTPDIYTPLGLFMKTAPRGLFGRPAGRREPKRFVMCTLLNNCNPDTNLLPELLAAYKNIKNITFSRYKKFANHRNRIVTVSDPEVKSAIYWNEKEALLLLANLAKGKRVFNWKIDAAALGWKNDAARPGKRQLQSLAPESYLYLPVKRQRL